MRVIVLAHEKPFSIGPVTVQPSTRSIVRGSRHEILEPKVMQVLVALGQAAGQVVSRDDLVEACWNGRIVGDDAINRVIGRLRRTAGGIGTEVFAIDTITRVGYRLRTLNGNALEEPERDGPAATAGPRLSRRDVLVGATAAAGLAVGGWFFWRRPSTEGDLSPATAAIVEQARIAMAQDTREGQNQAIALFRRVIDDSPDYADGWGLLACTYAWTSHFRQSSEAEVLRDRAHAAARQAMAIDPVNGLAIAGATLARPVFGNWLPISRDLRRAVAKEPATYELTLSLAKVLSQVGRTGEALRYISANAPLQPIPTYYYNRAQLLWSVGQMEELDSLFAEAGRVYPTHFAVWFTRFYIPMLSGRPEESLALAADPAARPSGIDPAEIESVVRVAEAVRTRAPDRIDAVTREWMDRAHHGAGYAENAAQFLSVLGRRDEAFEVLKAYYFSSGFDCGEGRFSSSQGTFTPRNDRFTAFLFNPAMASVRADARFGAMVRDLGLAEYWRASGQSPDYLLSRP